MAASMERGATQAGHLAEQNPPGCERLVCGAQGGLDIGNCLKFLEHDQTIKSAPGHDAFVHQVRAVMCVVVA